MKKETILYYLGWVLKIEGLLLFIPILTGLYFHENVIFKYLLVAALCFCIGFIISISKPKNEVTYAKEGFVIVALSWIVLSIFGCLPFYLTKEIPSFADALFETISGFTTTGASILTNVESLSHASIMWRSFTHWIGGMGVLVFMLIIIPMKDGSNVYLMKSESPGPTVSKLVPKLKDSAIILYGIYFVMTIIEIILLIASRMPVFDSFCLSFGSAGTGGFGIKSDSLASYNPVSQGIITIFMFLFGVNFSFYFLLIKKRFKDAFAMEEVRWYFAIFFIVSVIIAINTTKTMGSIFSAIHHSFFQVSSIMTTTGYSSCDFDLWPELSKTLLLIIMFIGACAGSTGGGLKVSRIIILVKQSIAELRTYIHPRNVKVMLLDGKRVEETTIKQVLVYFGTFFIIFFMSVVLISIDNFDFTSNFSAVAATINNIGPGLNVVGPSQSYAGYSIFSKYVLMFCMLAGRLEMYPLLIFFYPRTWKNN